MLVIQRVHQRILSQSWKDLYSWLGFHYADKETALYYLHATLEFTRKYGRFRQEVGRSETLHPLRRGRYFILKSSLVPVKEILDTYDALKEEYTNMVSEDTNYK